LSEYAIIWGTFIAIVVTNNLEIGFGIGVGLCVLHFMFLYATSNAVKRLAAASTVIRGFRQRRTLAHHRTTIAAHGLQGYIFFGSALAILREVKRSIYIEDAAEDDGGVVVTPTNPSRKNFVRLPKRLVSLENDRNSLNEHVVQRHTTMLPTRFVLLDFDNVSGVDATAVRSLFVSLAQTVSMHGITLVITAVPDGTFKLLKANGVIENFVDNFKAFKTLDLGLQYCEDALLEQVCLVRLPTHLLPLRVHRLLFQRPCATSEMAVRVARRQLPLRARGGGQSVYDMAPLLAPFLQIDPHLHPTRLTTADEDIHGILKAYIFESMSFPNPGKALGDNRALLLEYFDLLRVKEGSPLWLEGSASDTIYFVRTGSFLLYRDRAPAILTKKKRWLSWMSGHRDLPARTRMAQYGQGGLIGELDFFAHQPRSFSAVPLEDSEVYALTRTKLTTMYLEHSDLAALLQHVILKSLSLSAAQTRTQVHES
jgi:ABC-type transporter Mla MlaB component